MRNILSGIETRVGETSDTLKPEGRVHTLAIYGAFVLIAAIVFGTLSFRPF